MKQIMSGKEYDPLKLYAIVPGDRGPIALMVNVYEPETKKNAFGMVVVAPTECLPPVVYSRRSDEVGLSDPRNFIDMILDKTSGVFEMFEVTYEELGDLIKQRAADYDLDKTDIFPYRESAEAVKREVQEGLGSDDPKDADSLTEDQKLDLVMRIRGEYREEHGEDCTSLHLFETIKKMYPNTTTLPDASDIKAMEDHAYSLEDVVDEAMLKGDGTIEIPGSGGKRINLRDLMRPGDGDN